MSGYYVSRQNYYYSGQLAVEIAAGGIEYSGCDMLAGDWDGEGHYDDPRQAATAALELLADWRKRQPEADIRLAFGHNLDLIEGSADATDDGQELLAWAQEEYDQIPKCDRCGGIITGPDWYLIDFSDEARYCSEACADRVLAAC